MIYRPGVDEGWKLRISNYFVAAGEEEEEEKV